MKQKKWQNIKLTLSYDGSCFGGWQRVQNGKKPSIQATLEQVIGAEFPSVEELQVIGSGRTDAGVHAWGQVANVHVPVEEWRVRTPMEWRDRWNDRLPEGLRIRQVEEAPADFHSRYDAVGKTYCYTFDLREKPGVFRRKYVWAPDDSTKVERSLNGRIRLDLAAMKQAAGYLLGEHDFTAFASKMEPGRGTVRRIDRLEFIWESTGKKSDQEMQLLRMEVSGNGFLYHMVRILAGTLWEVGIGKRTPESVRQALGDGAGEPGKRSDTGVLLPPEGLLLLEVHYER